MGMYCFYNGSGDNGDAVTCSEAHGYAMLIAVLHGNQSDFDGLLSFFLSYRNNHGLMKWQVRMNSRQQLYVAEDAEDCATDGDIDIATALFLAASKWPHGSQMYPGGAYGAEAARLCDALMAHCIHPSLHVPLLGDWCNQDGRDNRRLYDSTRSSDFILSSFLLFHLKHPDPHARSRWQQVLEATLQVALSQMQHTHTGLIADFLVYESRHGWHPPRGKHLESKYDGEMSWNACRTRTYLDSPSVAPRALLRRERRPAHPASAPGDAPHASLVQIPRRSRRNPRARRQGVGRLFVYVAALTQRVPTLPPPATCAMSWVTRRTSLLLCVRSTTRSRSTLATRSTWSSPRRPWPLRIGFRSVAPRDSCRGHAAAMALCSASRGTKRMFARPKRAYSSRAPPHAAIAVPKSIDRLAAALADQARVHAEVGDPIYSYRRPLGTVPRCYDQLYAPDVPSEVVRKPKVTYLDSEREVDALLPGALARCGTVAKSVGFDLEWNMGQFPGRTAVMQLGMAKNIYIIHLSAMGCVPQSIREMLADPHILKVGVAVRNDGHKLRRDFKLVSNGLVELSAMAKALDPSRWKHRRLLVSLRDLCQSYLDRTLRKDAVRVSRWTNTPLSHLQQEYAASDAYVGLELFHQLVLRTYERATRRVLEQAPADLAATPYEAAMAVVRHATSSVCDAPPKPKKARPNRLDSSFGPEKKAYQRALAAWRTKQLTFAELASRACIRIGTSARYVMRALDEELAAQRAAGRPCRLSDEERERLRAEFASGEVRRNARFHYVFLRDHHIFTHAELAAMK